MGEQISLFDLLDEEERQNEEERRIIRGQQSYIKWLHTPELSPISMVPEEDRRDFNVYSISPEHICDVMPEGVKIWQNTTCADFWVLNQKGQPQGERISVCPYCGRKPGEDIEHTYLRRWLRGETYYQEATVRRYLRLDELGV